MSGNAHASRDPLPEQPWRETSSPGIRRLALQATAEAVAAVKEARKRPVGECGNTPPHA